MSRNLLHKNSETVDIYGKFNLKDEIESDG